MLNTINLSYGVLRYVHDIETGKRFLDFSAVQDAEYSNLNKGQKT
jgi:hypothetical protein